MANTVRRVQTDSRILKALRCREDNKDRSRSRNPTIESILDAINVPGLLSATIVEGAFNWIVAIGSSRCLICP